MGRDWQIAQEYTIGTQLVNMHRQMVLFNPFTLKFIKYILTTLQVR